MSYRQEYLSFSAPELFKKMNKMKLDKNSEKMLDIFTSSQNVLIDENEWINKDSLFSFLSLLSKSFSLKKGLNIVKPPEARTALILYYHLTHSPNLTSIIKGDSSVLYKADLEKNCINNDMVVSSPALKRLDTFMERITNYIPKKSILFRKQIKSSILMLAGILGENSITRKNIDDSYNLLRILIFRTPLNEYEVLGDFFQLLNTEIYKRLSSIRIGFDLLNHLKQTFHYRESRRLSAEGKFPNPSLQKFGISKFPIEAFIYNIAEIYGLRNKIAQVKLADMDKLMEHVEKILLNYDFSFPGSFTSFPLCTLRDLYKHAFNFDITPSGKELLFRIRKSLTAAVSKMVGRNEYVFNYSGRVPRVISSIYTLASLYTYRMNHRVIDVEEIKYGIRGFYFFLNKFKF